MANNVERFNRLAVLSFALSVLLFSFVAAMLGHLALRQLRNSGERGRGLALAGVVIGWFTTGIFTLAVSLPGEFGYWVGFVVGSLFG